jgi:chemotaxis protein MotB
MGKLSEGSSSDDGGGDGGGGWLVSYADLMTLIACFFILMVAFANFDPVGFQEKTKIVAKHFNKDKSDFAETRMKKISEAIQKHPKIKDVEEMMKISVKDNELIIVVSGSAVFQAGSITLNDTAIEAMDVMIEIIKTLEPNYRILVEGHTDDQLVSGEGVFRDNWTLSGARSASVVSRFERAGFDPRKMSALALADTKPLAPNYDEKGNAIPENQKLNRRVVVKVLQHVDPKNSVKMGLGVFFQESTHEFSEY